MSCGHSVLLVEDDPGISTVLSYYFETHGYDVVLATNGQEGIDALGAMARPCAVILDLMMPTMDGKEFLEAQSGLPAGFDVPVIVITASVGQEEIPRHPNLVAALRKPFPLLNLLTTVASCCALA